MNYQIFPAFAVPIGTAKLDKDCCEPLKKLESVPQSATKDHEVLYDQLSKEPEVKKVILDVFTEYINGVNGTPEQEYKITTSWITENNDGSEMTRHRHFNSYYSSVFYFDEVADEHPPLVFDNPLDKGGFFTNPQRLTTYTNTFFDAPIMEGLILFFPSYIYHHHRPFEFKKVPRKSLACNYIPIGKIGQFDSSLDTRTLHG